MRVLITGADGFVGKHATPWFRERGHDVLELYGRDIGAPAKGHVTDIRDPIAVRSALDWARPQWVLHLAGASSVTKSHEQPDECHEVNTVGTEHLLDAIRSEAPSARVLIVSSGEVYGPTEPGKAASESDTPNPTSPYARSKLAAEDEGRKKYSHSGIHVVIARPFNHLGRGQAAGFAVPSFARQLARIRVAGAGELRVGNLEAIRDFLHVLDVVKAYEILLARAVEGETYNIASGVGRSVGSLLNEMIELAGLHIKPTIDPSRLRAVDLPRLVGNAAKLRELGWIPTRTVREALNDVVEEEIAVALER